VIRPTLRRAGVRRRPVGSARSRRLRHARDRFGSLLVPSFLPVAPHAQRLTVGHVVS